MYAYIHIHTHMYVHVLRVYICAHVYTGCKYTPVLYIHTPHSYMRRRYTAYREDMGKPQRPSSPLCLLHELVSSSGSTTVARALLAQASTQQSTWPRESEHSHVTTLASDRVSNKSQAHSCRIPPVRSL